MEHQEHQIGENIKRLRQSRKMSQSDLGKRVQLPQTIISRIERNKRNIKSFELIRFAKALGVSIEEILEEKRSNE